MGLAGIPGRSMDFAFDFGANYGFRPEQFGLRPEVRRHKSIGLSIAMKIAIGSDHAGFDYKEKIRVLLKELGHEVRDFGVFNVEPVDYSLMIRSVAEAVAVAEFDRAIALAGCGDGVAIGAN